MKKNIGFTLAEVLITLGIIGVVAALTIPTLINNYQKKVTLTRLKQSYSILQNAILASQVENGDTQTWGLSAYRKDYDDDTIGEVSKDVSSSICNKYLVPYLKTSEKPEYKSLKKAGWDEIYDLSGEKSKRPSIDDTYYIIPLANGSTIMANINGTENKQVYGLIFYIDINGPQKPNVSGKDLFVMELVLSSSQFGFYGDSGSVADIRNQLCTDKGGAIPRASMGCGALILKSGWEFPEDYPWK